MRRITIISLLQLLWFMASAQERQWFSEADIAGLNFPGDARNNAVSFVIGDTAYVGTGDQGTTTLTDFWKYIPATNTWTQIADFPGVKRTGAVAFVINGKGYVGLGREGSGSNSARYNDFYQYDPVTNQWDLIAPFGGTGRNNAIAFTINGKAYVGTGEDGYREYTDDLWEYDPTLGTWTLKGSLPLYPRTEAIAFTINGRGYIGCGLRSGFNFANNMYEYDPVANTFRKTNSFNIPYSRTNGVAFVLDEKAYIGLGFEKKDFVIYDPTNNDDIESTSMNTDGVEDQFGLPSESDRWGAVAFVIRGRAFVGLGGVNNGSSTNSDIWSFQYPTPNAPEALTIIESTLTAATLQWNDRSNNEQSFEIERSVGDNASFTSLATVAADVATYDDNTLLPNQLYYYRVRAIGQSDNSTYSNLVSVNTYSAPTNLIATVSNSSEITLSWTDQSTIETGFVIERAANGSTFGALDTVAADITTYTDAQITEGIDYQYRVYALVGSTNTDATNVATAGILTHPENLSVSSINSSTIRIAWDYSGNNASHYVIERQQGSGSFVRLDSIAIGDSQQYSDNTVEEALHYAYRIKTTDPNRSSDYSQSVQTTTKLHAPTAVTATVQDSTVMIRWNDASQHETHYVVRRSLADGSELIVVDTVEANTTSFQDTASLDSGDYRYVVQAIGSVTKSGSVESNTITIVMKEETVEEETEEEPTDEEETSGEEPEEGETEEPNEEEVVTETDDAITKEVVKAYPNPSNGLVYVHVGSERFAYIAVFNGQGQLIGEVQQAEQGSTATVSLDLQYLPAGIYTLRIYTSRGVFVRKITKQ